MSVRRVFLLGVIIFLIVLAVDSVLGEDWQFNVVDPLAGGTTSISIDSQDETHIAYYANGKLRYAHLSDGVWDIEVVFDDYIDYLDMSLDSTDCPHIAFYGYTDDELKYAFWNGDGWKIETIESSDYLDYMSLALDSDDNPHISYSHRITDELKYAYKNVDMWEIQIIESEYVGSSTSIAIDQNDYPCISYNSGEDLKMTRWTGSDWETQTIDSSQWGFRSISLVFDENYFPHLSYYDVLDMSDGQLKYAKWTGTEWDIQIVDASGCETGVSNSLAVDSENHPHISYFVFPYALELRYAYLNGSDWQIETIDDDYYGAGTYSSIAVDSTDNPHISYNSGIYQYVDLKYAWYGEPMQDINLTTFSAVDKGGKVMMLNWSCESTEGETIEGFNLYRREVRLTNKILIPVRTDDYPSVEVDTTWTKINEHIITGENPYSYIDDTVESGVTYEYRLDTVIEDTTETIGTTTGTCGLPTSFEITSIHPNPTTDSISITLSTPECCDVKLEVYDITGRVVKSVTLGEIEMGEHTEVLSTSDLSSGVYTVNATAGVEQSTMKMVVVK